MKHSRIDILVALALAVLFYGNDIAFDYVGNPAWWVGLDMAVRVIAIGLIVLSPTLRSASYDALVLRPQPVWLLYVLGLILTILIFDHYIGEPLVEKFPSLEWGIGTFDGYDSDNLRLFDLSIGLIVVAVSEELVSRSVVRNIYERYWSSQFGLVFVSALLFALIHWGGGPTGMLMPFFAGVILMIVFIRTGSLLPGIAAHYAINFYYYA
ncbi:MAG: CPBP family intramembrane metalloprotease [Magnetovibrio sp.]|nr:CPBP family intramembrane metalloprotease [Magnetovibrio sp.]